MPTYRLRVEAHFNGTVVMDRDKKSASRTQDSPQLEQPGVGEIRDMGEERACIDQVEGAILEREMRLACICGERERRAEVLLAEQDMLAQQIDAPDFTILQVVKPPDNPPVRTESRMRLAVWKETRRLRLRAGPCRHWPCPRL